MLLLGSTLPKNTITFLYKSTSYLFGPFCESDEDLREKKKTLLRFLRLCSPERLQLIKQSSETHPMCANRLLKLFRVSFTLFKCVKIWQQDCTKDGV